MNIYNVYKYIIMNNWPIINYKKKYIVIFT